MGFLFKIYIPTESVFVNKDWQMQPTDKRCISYSHNNLYDVRVMHDKRTWNITLSLNTPKNTSLFLTSRHRNRNALSAQHTNGVTSPAVAATRNNLPGDRKGAAHPLKKSKLIRVKGSEQSNFLAPPKLLKTQLLLHLRDDWAHYRNLISY